MYGMLYCASLLQGVDYSLSIINFTFLLFLMPFLSDLRYKKSVLSFMKG